MTTLIDMNYVDLARDFISAYWPFIGGIVPVPAIGVFGFNRRPRSASSEVTPSSFAEPEFLTPPLARPAYSDRMAYVLAEMAALAYHQFEGRGGFIEDAVQKALEQDLTKELDIRQFMDQFSADLVCGQHLSLASFEKVLENSGFSLVDAINIREAQGSVYKRDVPDEALYLVLAFRGTEKIVSDWLRDERCIPTVA